jgi:ADP-ribose pyrophosphatase
VKPVVAVGVVLLDGERVLLIERAHPPQAGRWTVPGGKVELGESLEAAALRELAEETGLSCTLGPIVEVLDRVVRGPDGAIQFHFVIIDFLGTEPRGELRAGSDSFAARFVDVAKLDTLPLTDFLEDVVSHARRIRDGELPGPVRKSQLS